jgi:hypothetical protein
MTQSVVLTNLVSGKKPHLRLGAESSGPDEARSPAATDSHVGRFSQWISVNGCWVAALRALSKSFSSRSSPSTRR